jgi:predicted phosphodiesterase
MRLAFLSDVHGNPIALDAVLKDIAAQGGVDQYWVLGDLVAIGYDPVGVLERLCALPSVRVLRGNTERYVLTGDRPPPSEADVLADPRLMAQFVEVARGFAWTAGYLAATGWMGWLARLPTELRAHLPDGTRLLAVHASPRADDSGLYMEMTDAELLEAVDGAEAEMVLVGHTHRPFARIVGTRHIVNLGSVSNPHGEDKRASYVLLTADGAGHEVRHCRVAYDCGAVIDAIQKSHHPCQAFLMSHFGSWAGGAGSGRRNQPERS